MKTRKKENTEKLMSNTNRMKFKDLNSSLIDNYIGKRLKLRRIMLHMSQDEVASLVGVTFQQVQKYESGATKISANRLFILAKILQVDIQFFFEGLEREHPEFTQFGEDANYVEDGSVRFDPLTDNETLTLVNLYWKGDNENRRKSILSFVDSMI